MSTLIDISRLAPCRKSWGTSPRHNGVEVPEGPKRPFGGKLLPKAGRHDPPGRVGVFFWAGTSGRDFLKPEGIQPAAPSQAADPPPPGGSAAIEFG